MSDDTQFDRRWTDWAMRVQAIGQIGKTYTKDPFDRDRFDELLSIANEILASLAHTEVGKVESLFLPEKGYTTPKVDLRAGVFKEGRILMVRERSDGKWTLPGGWADILETPIEGVIREVKEESGFDIANPRLVAVIDRGAHDYRPRYPYHIYKLFFLAELVGGSATANLEVDEIGFFALEELPDLSLSRVLPQDITRLFRFASGEEKGVYCD